MRYLIKKMTFIFLFLVLIVSCAHNTPNSKDEFSFEAIVLEVNEHSMLVKVTKPNELLNARIIVENLDDKTQVFAMNDVVKVFYNGVILESDPAQLALVYAIELVGDMSNP